MPILRTRLPPVYHRCLPDFIELPYPHERFATCDTCVNCQSSHSPYLTTKCCSYHPSLPNYLVGGVLGDASADRGREQVRAIIRDGIGVTPYGLVRSASRRLRPVRPLPTRAEAEAMLCPYYDAGRCSIWAHREHLCSTYFCYSTGGKAGTAFWQALNAYLRLVERELSVHALTTLGWPVEHPARPLADWLPPATSDADQQRRGLWRDWLGREVELYLECARVIAAIDRRTLETLLGRKGRRLEGRLRQLLAEFNNNVIPEELRAAPELQIALTSPGEVEVSVLGCRPVRMPRTAAIFLKQFDGVRGTTEVVRLAASIRVDLTPHLGALLAAGILRGA